MVRKIIQRIADGGVWVSVFFVVTGAALILILFLFFSSYYSTVKVKISTTNKNINLDELVFLNKDGAGGSIKYNLMKLEDTESSQIAVTGSKIVTKSAGGTATIYNMYSPAAQKLVIGTRLETKDGKIYKITNPVSVPGLSISNGQVVPGAVDVAVKASEPGDKYNIGPSDFTIPGLKGSPKFDKFYAKSSKDIAGGFSGEIKTASPSDITKARSTLEETIKQKLVKSAMSQVPSGFLLYDDGLFLDFKDNAVDGVSLTTASSGTGTFSVSGTLNAMIIDSAALKKLIVSKNSASASDDSKIIVSDLSKINFKILNRDRVNINGSDSVLANMTGKLSMVWDFDENALKNRLIGIKKSEYQTVFKDFPVIEKAEAVFTPSWAFYFPSDPKRIQIEKEFVISQ